jgi:hypothetical protein
MLDVSRVILPYEAHSLESDEPIVQKRPDFGAIRSGDVLVNRALILTRKLRHFVNYAILVHSVN